MCSFPWQRVNEGHISASYIWTVELTYAAECDVTGEGKVHFFCKFMKCRCFHKLYSAVTMVTFYLVLWNTLHSQIVTFELGFSYY